MAEHERALIERARGGNREAFAELVEPRFLARLRWQAFRILGDSEEAQDAAQETLLRAWEALPSFRLPPEGADAGAAFRGWCLQIARRAAIDRRRERARLSPLAPLDAERLSGPSETPRMELALAYAQAAALLTPRQLEAFELTLIEGHTAEEAAAMMGVEASTVRNLTMQARERLREKFRGGA